ncbi:MAG: hypothetical protein PHU70_04010 [Dehalococcoidia bacterium]|nr:hypothetical protein [Dehalococcoidia bacterium]MDD5647452.1 hypothetical protein [Dehalococcoidia bacterium]
MKLTWKPIMAGILDIVSGAIGMVGGVYFVVLTSIFRSMYEILHVDPVVIEQTEQLISRFFAIPFVLVFIGIIAIIGGVYALQRRIWVLALAGSICSCIVFPIFGLPSIIITGLAQEEFN